MLHMVNLHYSNKIVINFFYLYNFINENNLFLTKHEELKNNFKN
jgi:hypothetical protein